MRLPWISLIALWVLSFGMPEAGAQQADLVQVGVARVDITPKEPVRLHGYLARKKVSAGISQKLWAKALAIGSDEQGPVVLVSVDNLGVGEAIVEDVAARLARRAKLPRDRFAVASSHTHSAPCLTGVAPNIFGKPIVAEEQAAIDRYSQGPGRQPRKGVAWLRWETESRVVLPGLKERSVSRPIGARPEAPSI